MYSDTVRYLCAIITHRVSRSRRHLKSASGPSRLPRNANRQTLRTGDLCNDGLRDCFVVQDLTAIDLQTAQDLTEGALGADRLDVGQLRGERQAVRMASEDRPLARRQTSGDAVGQQVGGVDREPVDLSELAISQDLHAVARHKDFAQFRTLDLERRPSGHDDPAPRLGDILFIERLPQPQQNVDDFDLTRGGVATNRSDGSAGHAEVNVARDNACRLAHGSQRSPAP